MRSEIRLPGTYDSYLRSPHWQTTRRIALVDAFHRCRVCNSDERLEVHHRTYERLGREHPSDLTVLCRECHELFHERRRAVTRQLRLLH
ncbi:MAG: HNH endonuclease [Pseudomonadota bacterium]